jgi:hypothetical protein
MRERHRRAGSGNATLERRQAAAHWRWRSCSAPAGRSDACPHNPSGWQDGVAGHVAIRTGRSRGRRRPRWANRRWHVIARAVRIQDPADDVDHLESDHPGLKRLATVTDEFATHVRNSMTSTSNHGERWHYGEPISTSFGIMSAVNVVMGKRFAKRQQVQRLQRRLPIDSCRPAPSGQADHGGRNSKTGPRLPPPHVPGIAGWRHTSRTCTETVVCGARVGTAELSRFYCPGNVSLSDRRFTLSLQAHWHGPSPSYLCFSACAGGVAHQEEEGLASCWSDSTHCCHPKPMRAGSLWEPC